MKIQCDVVVITEDMVQAQWLDGNSQTFNINGHDDIDLSSITRGTVVYIIEQDVEITANYLNEV